MRSIEHVGLVFLLMEFEIFFWNWYKTLKMALIEGYTEIYFLDTLNHMFHKNCLF